MKKITRSLLLLLAVTITMNSCRKNDDDQTPNPEPVISKRVKKLIAGPNDHFSYTYNEQKQVTTYQSTWIFSPDGPVVKTYTVNYQYENGKVKESETAGGGKQLFTYEGNRPAIAEFYHPNGTKYATHQYSFNDKNQLTELVETITNADEISHVRSQYHYNQKGNLVKIVNQHKRKESNQYELTSTMLFEEHDSKWHPIPGEAWGQFLPGLVLHKNNPTRIKDLLPDGSVRQIVHMSYEYGADGYPTVRKQHLEINGQHKPEIRFEYEYE